MLRLDMARNSLLTINTLISLVSMCFGLGACVAGIFGAWTLPPNTHFPLDQVAFPQLRL